MNEDTVIDLSKLEKLEKETYWHKMAYGYLPISYYDKSYQSELPTLLSRGQVISSVLQGMLHRGLLWFADKATMLCVFVSLGIFIAFVGAWFYNAFMPIMHATALAITGTHATVSAAIAWLGIFGTAMFAVFLTVGIFSIIIICWGNDSPEDRLTEISEYAVYKLLNISLRGFNAIGSVIRSLFCATIGEKWFVKLTSPIHSIEKKLGTLVIIE